MLGTWVGRLLLMLAMVGCALISAGFVAITVLYAMGDLDDPGDTVPGLPPTPVMTVPLAIACGAFAYGCWVAFADTVRPGEQPEGVAPPL
jgi:hypothetical protein